MASVIYQATVQNIANGVIVFGTNTFFMLLTNGYVPVRNVDSTRANVTNEVVGTGYTTGGKVTAATVVRDDLNSDVNVNFAAVSWTAATITANGAVIYKNTGGPPASDPLVCFIDFGGTFTSTAGTFTVTPSTPFKFHNLT